MESRVVFVSKALQSAATIESPLPQIPDDQNDRVSKHARKILIPNIGPRTITDEYTTQANHTKRVAVFFCFRV